MTTKRLFLALNATNPLAESFQPTFKKLKINADRRDITVKWVPLDNFHITLSFLGDRYVEEIPHIAHVLKQVCEQTAPFELKIEDLSAFSSETEAPRQGPLDVFPAWNHLLDHDALGFPCHPDG